MPQYPLLEDWAKIYGVTIEWVHEWEKDETKRMTAFGYDQDGVAKHHTLIVQYSTPRGACKHPVE